MPILEEFYHDSPGTLKAAQKILIDHNIFRAAHDAEPLTLNRKLTAESRAYAIKLQANYQKAVVAAKNDKMLTSSFPHDPDCEDGENIWSKVGNNSVAFTNGHFTQVVWRGSKEIGVGISSSGTDEAPCVVVVCRYNPPGNMEGEYPLNVVAKNP